MNSNITYRELHEQACVRHEVYGEIKILVEGIYWSRGMDDEKKLAEIFTAVKERMSLSCELVALSSTLRKRSEEIR